MTRIGSVATLALRFALIIPRLDDQAQARLEPGLTSIAALAGILAVIQREVL